MAEIEITLPTVQYGNVKVRATPEEFGFRLDEPSAFGVALAVYHASFVIGWQDGAQMDVSAPQAASKEGAPGSPQAAAERLADGRSPRTVDEANEMAKQVIENELGGVTEVDEYDSATEAKEAAQARSKATYDAAYSAPNDGPEPAPWDLEVALGPKPWETGVTAPAVLDATW